MFHSALSELVWSWVSVMACRLWRKAVVNRAVAKPRLGPLGVHPTRLRAPLALRDMGRVDAEHEGFGSPWFQRLRRFSSPGFLADFASPIEDGRLIRRPSGAQVSREKLAAVRECKVAGMTQRDSVAKLDLPSSTVQRYWHKN